MEEWFDWERDCGWMVSPSEAAQAAREAGQTYEEYARDYLEQWPFPGEEPPEDLIEGMVTEMEAAQGR